MLGDGRGSVESAASLTSAAARGACRPAPFSHAATAAGPYAVFPAAVAADRHAMNKGSAQ